MPVNVKARFAKLLTLVEPFKMVKLSAVPVPAAVTVKALFGNANALEIVFAPVAKFTVKAPVLAAPKLRRLAVALMLANVIAAPPAKVSEAAIVSTLVTVKVVGVAAEAVTRFAAVAVRVSVPSPPLTVSAVVKLAVKVMLSVPAPPLTLLAAAAVSVRVMESLPVPPVITTAVAASEITVRAPAKVDALTVVATVFTAPKFSACAPLMFSVVA